MKGVYPMSGLKDLNQFQCFTTHAEVDAAFLVCHWYSSSCIIVFEFDVAFGGYYGQIMPITSACLRFCGAMFSVQIFHMPLWVFLFLDEPYSQIVSTTWEEFLGFGIIITFYPSKMTHPE